MGEPTLAADEYDDWAAAWEWAARAEDPSFTLEERIRAALKFFQADAVSTVEKQQKKREWLLQKHDDLGIGLMGQIDLTDIFSNSHSLHRELLRAKTSHARMMGAMHLISAGNPDGIQVVECMFPDEPDQEVKFHIGKLLGFSGHASGIEYMNDQFQKLIAGEPFRFRAELHSYDFYRASIAHFAARQGNRAAAEYCAKLFETTSCLNTLRFFAFLEIPGQHRDSDGAPKTRDQLVRYYKKMAEE